MSKKNEFQTKALAAVMTASMVTGMAPASVYAASGEQVLIRMANGRLKEMDGQSMTFR